MVVHTRVGSRIVTIRCAIYVPCQILCALLAIVRNAVRSQHPKSNHTKVRNILFVFNLVTLSLSPQTNKKHPWDGAVPYLYESSHCLWQPPYLCHAQWRCLVRRRGGYLGLLGESCNTVCQDEDLQCNVKQKKLFWWAALQSDICHCGSSRVAQSFPPFYCQKKCWQALPFGETNIYYPRAIS